MIRTTFVLFLQVLRIGLLAAITCHAAESPERAYQKLTADLERANSPAGQAKVLAKMSDMNLKQAAQEVAAGNFEPADLILSQYAEVVRQAHEIMRAVHEKTPKKQAGAYRELELALRKQERRLHDLKNSLAFDRQEKIKQAIEVNESTREDMLSYIFGEENVKGDKKSAAKTP
jgi:hypothetical protein